MSCPPAIAAIILDILGDGLISIRSAGGSGDSAECASMADHLHNLPQLLRDYSPELLEFYWDVERPSFAAQCSRELLEAWEDRWDRLRPHVEVARTLVAVR